MDEQRATNVTWHSGQLQRSDREKRNGHRGAVLWFTGLSGSGKSTLAHVLEHALAERGAHSYVLDGDNVRHGLNKDLTFSPEDRKENIRRISEVAKLFTDAGIITLVAFISPYREDRQRARAIVGEGFFEVYVACDLEVCESRDPKGLYKKARAGEIQDFTGINAPYEAPEHPEIRVDTSTETLDRCVLQLLEALENARIWDV